MKLIDLHNHTNFSYDGTNTPEEIIENAIANGISIIGISDHQFSLADRLDEYILKINECKKKYSSKIQVKCGLEIGTRPQPKDLLISSLTGIDYCLFECLDSERAMDIYEFSEWIKLFKMPKGLAHTDIFYLAERYDINIFEFLIKNNLFWEINTSGNYNYYYDFITNRNKREMIKQSQITVSVGSDTHWTRDFNLSKLKSVLEVVINMGNKIIFY